MTPSPTALPRSSLRSLLLSGSAHQRIRLAHCGAACLLVAGSVVDMQYLVWAGIAPVRATAWWSAVLVLGFAGFFLVIRSGLNLRFRDPSLTLAQMVFAILCGAAGYALAGRGRGGAFPILMVIFMFSMYSLKPPTVRRVGLFALAVFGTTMALLSWWRPHVYEPLVEFGHFIMIAIMLPAVSILAAQFSRLRERMRNQKAELEQAMLRIQNLATRDELTGITNRRHMQELLQLEHQRCVRSGHTFCLAVIDLDHFKQVNERHGRNVGDETLLSFAREALTAIRISDVLARWGGESFLLLMSDTRGPMARQGVERLRAHTEGLRLASGSSSGEPIRLTLSAGVVEHFAGESVADAIERAERALKQAKAQGRNRVVMS